MNTPANQIEALTQALLLSVLAPTEAKSQAALELAENFASGLSNEQVALCKANAEKMLKASEQKQNASDSKLLEAAHQRYAAKQQQTFGNFGWVKNENSICSKTDKGYLTTKRLDSGKYVHEFQAYE